LCDNVTDKYWETSYTESINPIKPRRFTMKRNMSNTDRIVRVVIAALFAYLYFGGIVTGILGIVLVVLGAVFLLTAATAFCPLYAPFKFSTNK
jgi:hypothetical protein